MKKRKKQHSSTGGVQAQPSPTAPKPVAAASPPTVVPPGLPDAVEQEPATTAGPPMPILPIVLLAVLLYLGYLYLADTAGGFDARVFAPYTSVAQLAALQPKSEAEEQYAQGRRVFTYICVQCHQETGRGNPALFIPPLVGSEWVLAPEAGRIIRSVSKGLTGPITVAGQQFGTAAMFAAGDQLPGDEEAKCRQIAAVLTYIRNSWGNKAAPVTVDQVKAVRAKIQDRTQPWTAEELLKIPENE